MLPGLLAAPPIPLLAPGRVHFVGQPVATVVARSAAEARDAVDCLDVDDDLLPAVLDLESAIAALELR